MRPWYFVHCARRLAMSGRERSPATTLFFEAQLLGMDELPHRTIVDPQATLTELDNQAAQREVSFSDPLRKPNRMLAGNCPGLVTAHLPRSDTAGLFDPPHPTDRCTDSDPESFGRLIAGHAARNRCYQPIAKIL